MASTEVDEVSASVEDLLALYDDMFKRRYTEEDPEYMKTVNTPLPPPPCVKNWYQKPKGNFRNRGGGRGYGDRRGHYHDNRGGYGNRRDYHHGNRDNYNYHNQGDRNRGYGSHDNHHRQDYHHGNRDYRDREPR